MEVAQSVVWVQNKHSNTGRASAGACTADIFRGKDTPSDPGGVLVQARAGKAELDAYVANKGWVMHQCLLANELGLDMEVYAAPIDFRKEHKGKNNVVATFLTNGLEGLGAGTVCGRALVKARDPTKGVTYDQVQKMYTFMMDMVDYWADDDPEYGPKMRAAAKVLFPFYHYHDCWSGTHLEKRVTYSESKAYYPEDVEELRAWVEANPPVSDQAISDGFRAEQEEVMRDLGEVGNPEIL